MSLYEEIKNKRKAEGATTENSGVSLYQSIKNSRLQANARSSESAKKTEYDTDAGAKKIERLKYYSGKAKELNDIMSTSRTNGDISVADAVDRKAMADLQKLYEEYEKKFSASPIHSTPTTVQPNFTSGIAGVNAPAKPIDFDSLLAEEQKKYDRAETKNLYGTIIADPNYEVVMKTADETPAYRKGLHTVRNRTYVTAPEGMLDTFTSVNDEMDSIVPSFMTEEERTRYKWLWGNGEYDKAEEFYQSIKSDLEERAHTKAIQNTYQQGKDHPGFTSAQAAVRGALAAPAEAVADTAKLIKDTFTNPDNVRLDRNQTMELVDAANYSVSEDMSPAGRFLYNTAMSGAQSLLSATAFGKLGGVAMALSAAGAAVNDGLDRGMTDVQAMQYGIAAGVFEGLFETWSIGHFLKEIPADTIKVVLVNIAKSMGVNASEEWCTEVANIIYDTIAHGELSHAQQMIAEGKTKGQVIGELALQTVEAAGSGALMGAGFSSVNNIIGVGANVADAIEKGKEAKNKGITNDLIDAGMRYEGTEAYKLAEKASKRATNYRVGRLSQVMTKSAMQSTFAKETGNTETAKALTDIVMGKEVGNSDIARILADEKSLSALNNVLGTNIASGTSAKEVKSAVKEAVGRQTDDMVDSLKEDLREPVRELVKGNIISDSKIEAVLKDKTATAILSLRTGIEINDKTTAQDIKEAVTEAANDHSRARLALVYAASLDMGENGAKGVARMIDNGSSNIASAVQAYNAVYRAGRSGKAITEAKNPYLSELTLAERMAAYEYGVMDSLSNNPNAEYDTDKAVNLKGGEVATPVKNLTRSQQSVVDAGKTIGVNVVIAKVEKNGKNIDGLFDGETLYINPDPNSGNPMFVLVKHELTHFTEKALDKYDDFAKAVTDSATFAKWLRSKGYDGVDSYLDMVVKNYKDIGKNYEGEEGRKKAHKEMVANFVADTLYGGDEGFKRFTNELSEDHRRTLGDIIRDFIDWIKKKLGIYDEVKTLEKRYAELFKDAKNSTNTTKEISSNILKNDSIRDIIDVDYSYKGGYYETDEFRELQKRSREMSGGDSSLYHAGIKKIDDEIRGRLSRTFRLELNSAGGKRIYSKRTLLNPKSHQNVTLLEVDGNLFHDIFEISRAYLRNGELVDLHDEYNNATCYLTEDGLSGFAIEDDGNLVSVFNLSNERGFLRTIAPVIKENAMMLDCYASEKQDLQQMYSLIFGFKTASIMDYNMEYDHDNIAENHGMPKVAFMVNTDAEVEMRKFNKDQYDEAVEYQRSFVETDTQASYTPKDTEYLDAVNRGDIETAQRMVDEAAKDWGAITNGNTRVPRPLHLYHGTGAFGFTRFHDGRIYATTAQSVAAGYNRGRGLGRVRSSSLGYIPNDGTVDTAIKNAKNVLGAELTKLDDAKKRNIISKADNILKEVATKVAELDEVTDYGKAGEFFEYLTEKYGEDKAIQWTNDLDSLHYMLAAEYTVDEIMEDGEWLVHDLKKYHEWKQSLSELWAEEGEAIKNATLDKVFRYLLGYEYGDALIDIEFGLGRLLDNKQKLVNANGSLVYLEDVIDGVEMGKDTGIYDLYGHPGDKPLIIDEGKRFWDAIPFENGFRSTDYIVNWAKEHGYTSVLFKTVLDPSSGGSANIYADEWVFFDSNQVKSADPVTYDDNGEVIPLSERFNPDNDDIRYSYTPEKSTRDILASMMDTVAESDTEKRLLAKYKSYLKRISDDNTEIASLREQRKNASKAQKNVFSKKIGDLQRDISDTERRLSNLEKLATIKRLVEVEREKLADEAHLAGQMAQGRQDAKMIRNRDEKIAEAKAELQRQKKQSEKDVREAKELGVLAGQMAQGKKDAAVLRHAKEDAEKLRKARDKKVEDKKLRSVKGKITDTVKELNSLLKQETKDKHVHFALQEAVRDSLLVIDFSEEKEKQYAEKIAKIDEDIAKAIANGNTQSANYAELIDKRARAQASKDNIRERLEKIKESYEKIYSASETENIPSYYREQAKFIGDIVDEVMKKVGDTPYSEMTIDQYVRLYEMYKVILTTVKDANKVFRNGKVEDLIADATALEHDLEAVKKLDEERWAGADKAREFIWNELTPYYAFNRIGSEKLMEYYWDLIRGQDTYSRDVKEAEKFATETRKKYGYDKWDVGKIYTIKDKNGWDFRLTLKHMMSIYAYSKRDQAEDHMSKGGFFFNDKETFTKKGGVLDFIKANEHSYKVGVGTIKTIIDTLTDVDPNIISYVDEMQDYLTKMGEKGNEVTRRMWGINVFKEKHYFPLKSKEDFIYQANTPAETSSLKNDGMTKETKPHASNPIVLEAFDEVWDKHVEKMSKYHAFVIPIDNLNKLINYGTWVGEDTKSISLMLSARFGNAVNQYLNNFIKDLNGAKAQSTMGWAFATNLVNKFKKTAVAASMSVVVQQPTAVLRALSELDIKYFMHLPKAEKLNAKWDLMQEYAPIVTIKEIGGFDSGSGRSAIEVLGEDRKKGLEKAGRKIDDLTMYGAALGDRLGWASIWNAVEEEISDTTDYEKNSKEFYEAVGKRFTEVIVKTQVYDSTLSRSGFMRGKDGLIKMAMAFKGEPTLSFNMLFDAVDQARRGKISKKQAVQSIAAVYSSIIAATLVKSLIYALRDEDEDESYLEKYFQAVGGNIFSDTFLLSMLPMFSDVMSIIEGYDVERSDMAVVADLVDAVKNLDSESRTTYRKIEDLAGAMGGLIGVPVSNIMRTFREGYNVFENIFDGVDFGDVGVAFKEGLTGKEMSKSESLYNAIMNNDTARIEVYRKNYKDEDAYKSALKKSLRENDPRVVKSVEQALLGNYTMYNNSKRSLGANKRYGVKLVNDAFADEREYVLNKLEEARKARKARDMDEYNKIIDALVERGYSRSFIMKKLK